MKEYNDFLRYLTAHGSELQYDSSSLVKNAYQDGISLSEQDIALVAQISTSCSIAVLRAYHNWMQNP